MAGLRRVAPAKGVIVATSGQVLQPHRRLDLFHTPRHRDKTGAHVPPLTGPYHDRQAHHQPPLPTIQGHGSANRGHAARGRFQGAGPLRGVPEHVQPQQPLIAGARHDVRDDIPGLEIDPGQAWPSRQQVRPDPLEIGNGAAPLPCQSGERLGRAERAGELAICQGFAGQPSLSGCRTRGGSAPVRLPPDQPEAKAKGHHQSQQRQSAREPAIAAQLSVRVSICERIHSVHESRERPAGTRRRGCEPRRAVCAWPRSSAYREPS